jgi:S1-C subfamily serine protease
VTQALSNRDLFVTISQAAADLAASVAASTVQVHGRPRRPASGVVLGPERVVTTSHSVEWEEGIRVRGADGEERAAEVAGHAEGADVVLLRVPGLTAPVLEPAREIIRPGALVLIAGRSWSGNPHVRLAAVTGVGGPVRTTDGTTIEQVFGVPVSPYPGVSGSAIVDATGRLAGLATAGIARGRVLGLPATALLSLAETLDAKGSIGRGFLGVTTHAVTLANAQSAPAGQARGLVVVGVAPESPAAGAGVLVGDVVLQAAGATVESPDDLLSALGPERVGHSLSLRVLRGTSVNEVPVIVGARPARW